MALDAGRLGHPDRQHRVVPVVLRRPIVQLLPLLFLLHILRGVGGKREVNRLAHAVVADGASDLVQRVWRIATQVLRQVGMRAERLRVFLVALRVDRQMARLAAVHLRHPHEVHVVHDGGQHDLLHLDRGRQKIRHRGIKEEGLHEAGRNRRHPPHQPAPLGQQLVDLCLRLPHLRRELAQRSLRLHALGRRRLNREIQPCDHGRLLGDRRLFLRPGTPGVTPHLEGVPIHVIGGLGELIVLGLQAEPGIQFVHHILQFVDLGPVGSHRLAGRGALLLRQLELLSINPGRGQLQLLVRHLHLEAGETPLRVLPVPIEVIPDHPEDAQEQEDARRREDDVEKVDVIGVSDRLFIGHVRY